MAKVHAQVMGGDIKELADVSSVADVKSRLQATNHTATVNGEAVEDDYELSDFEFVTLAPAVKGGLN
jgi:hypothetical protein